MLSAIALFLTRDRKFLRIEDNGELKIGLIFAGIMGVITFILLSAANLTPDIAGARMYYHDLTNGVALFTSAYNGFPLEFLQMSNTAHFYHPFFYAFGAVMKHCLGFSSFDIGTKFTLITIAPFFGAAFIAVARKLFHKTRNLILAAASLILFFYPIVYYTTIDLLGFALSVSFALSALLFFTKAEETECRFFNRFHVLSMLFMIGCLGAKGANGVTTVFALCFALLLGLIRKGNWLHTITTGLLYAVPFFASYFLLYQQGPESMYLRGTDMLNQRMDYFLTMPESWPEWLRVFFSNAMFTINFNRLLCLCFVLLLIYLIAFRKKPKIIVDYTFGGLLAGLILSNVFMQHGSSEVYFLYIMIPMAVVAGLYCIIRFLLAVKGRKRLILGILFAVILLPLLVLETFSTAENVAPFISDAIQYSPFSKTRAFTDEQIEAVPSKSRPAILTAKEYEGLVWLRDNADPDAVVAEGRHMIYNKFFCGTAFGERRFFLEGWGYVTMEDSNTNTPEKVRRDAILTSFYDSWDESFVPLLRYNGIDYVILYQYQNPGWRFTNEFGSKTVFENEHIAIYDIRENA